LESQKTTYRNLAAIEILHHHFLDKGNKVYESNNDLTAEEKAHRLRLYDIRDWLTIKATNESKEIMARLGVRYKISPLSIQLFTEVDAATNKPLKSLDKLRLEFDVTLNPSIAPYTALARFAPDQYYLFGNQRAWLYANAVGSLCQVPSAFSAAETYLPGEVIQSAGNYYMALKVTGNLNQAPPNVAFWAAVNETVAFANGANFVQANSRDRPGIAFKVAISGQKGMGDFSLTSATDVIQNLVFKIHLNKI